ncbi:hypothetical protein KAJ02_09510 [Candidatus Bipolaricaulota bacterium]|nr:hypothetical protein [Candidatus Bipolaricaulota bacterium]
MKKKKGYVPKAKSVTAPLFGEHAHRWPDAAHPMAYAMACVEVVANSSPRAGELYRELVAAWGTPGAKALYHQVMAAVPEEDVQEWKEKLRNPGLVFRPDLNEPFHDITAQDSATFNHLRMHEYQRSGHSTQVFVTSSVPLV